MACKTVFLPAAWEDLKRIEDGYLVQCGCDQAVRALNRLLDSLERPERSADAGAPTPDEWLNRRGYRMAVCGKYIVVYREAEDKRYICHIADGRMEYAKVFG